MRTATVLSACLLATATASRASVICSKAGGTGTLRFRPTACRVNETQIGSFDGTTLQFTGINVQVVSGSGATDGVVNGRGNLIVGYDANVGGHDRSGSHNLVVGDEHTFSSYGGIVGGFQNAIVGPSAAVTGGAYNIAGSRFASVSGGEVNVAGLQAATSPGLPLDPAEAASVSGGYHNTASGGASSVCGGVVGTANGDQSSVTGGEHNVASGSFSAVAGGAYNVASGPDATVSGGFVNAAGTYFASVSGGAGNVAGSGTPPTPIVLQTGQAPAVCGGLLNVAAGAASSVSGGTQLLSTGPNEWHAGRTSGFPIGTEY